MNKFLTNLYSSHFESQARQKEFNGESGTEERMVVGMLKGNASHASTQTTTQSRQSYQNNQANYDRKESRAAALRAKNRDWGQNKQEEQPAKADWTVWSVLGYTIVVLMVVLTLFLR